MSVNPVDVKIRARDDPGSKPRILGWDAAGVIVGTGSAVTRFRAGDEVFYAGTIARPGTNSQFHVVDERITGAKLASLDFARQRRCR